MAPDRTGVRGPAGRRSGGVLMFDAFVSPFPADGDGPTPLIVGNASGFYGDRLSAVREMLTGGPLDVLTGDYLAELTMLILGRDRARNPDAGYARTFLRQLEESLGLARDHDVTLVTNAGGLAPARLADDIRTLADKLGLDVRVAHVEGDDLLPRAAELGLGAPLAANAYLGGWGIAKCLRAGANVVVTGRVTDASLVLGPAAAHFGWTPATSTRSPGPSSRGTSSSAEPRPPAGTTPSSPTTTRACGCVRGSRSPRSSTTGRP